MRIVNVAIELKRSASDHQTIMEKLNFDPRRRISDSDLRYLPTFFQIILFDLILPLCDRIEMIEEAIDLTDRANNYSPFLFDFMNEKFPQVLSFFNQYNFSLFSKSLRALTRIFPKHDIVGLDYFLSRDIANPFDIEILKEMKPDAYRLMITAFANISLSLTEIDMIA